MQWFKRLKEIRIFRKLQQNDDFVKLPTPFMEKSDIEAMAKKLYAIEKTVKPKAMTAEIVRKPKPDNEIKKEISKEAGVDEDCISFEFSEYERGFEDGYSHGEDMYHELLEEYEKLEKVIERLKKKTKKPKTMKRRKK